MLDLGQKNYFAMLLTFGSGRTFLIDCLNQKLDFHSGTFGDRLSFWMISILVEPITVF